MPLAAGEDDGAAAAGASDDSIPSPPLARTTGVNVHAPRARLFDVSSASLRVVSVGRP